MKIAVITFCNNGNYGSELQALAMNHFCRILGHEAIFYQVKGTTKISRCIQILAKKLKTNFRCIYDNEYRKFHKMLSENSALQLKLPTEVRHQISEYVAKNLNIQRTSKYHILHNHSDCYICGSDQIWSPLIMPFDPVNYLSKIDSKRKIAYAPSFGMNDLPQFYIKKAMPLIQDFRYLSIREAQGEKAIFQHTGLTAKVVLDPTLMIDSSFWAHLCESETIVSCAKDTTPYCLCYFLGQISQTQSRYIRHIAGKRKIYVLPYSANTDVLENSEFLSANPAQFLQLIKGADYIFTDSFHGTAFSLIFEKPFVTFKRSHLKGLTQTSRIESLLELVSLQDRYCEDATTYTPMAPIDYSLITVLLQQKRLESQKFLKSALESIEQSISKQGSEQ